MVPPQQCLEPDDVDGVEIDDRLVVQHQLVVLERGVEIMLEARAPSGAVAHLEVEDRDRVAAGFLRLVHRRVGIPQE